MTISILLEQRVIILDIVICLFIATNISFENLFVITNATSS